MEELTGLDARFLYSETPTAPDRDRNLGTVGV